MNDQVSVTPAKRGNGKGNGQDFPKSSQSTTPTASDTAGDSPRDAAISEVAYFLAEARGFEPGQELEDWFIAEQLVMVAENRDCSN